MLEEHRVCLCIYDLLPRHPRRITAKTVYIRFHGTTAKYGGNYSRAELRQWAVWMREMAEGGCYVYAYFNNDREAFPVRNAQTLRDLLTAAEE